MCTRSQSLFTHRPVFSVPFCNRLELRDVLFCLSLNLVGLKISMIRISLSPSRNSKWRPQNRKMKIFKEFRHEAMYLCFYYSQEQNLSRYPHILRSGMLVASSKVEITLTVGMWLPSWISRFRFGRTVLELIPIERNCMRV